MKVITLSKVGYNAPQGANWAYGVWKIDTIDTEQGYCMGYTVKETFGGESRLKETIKTKTGFEMIETKGVYTKTGTPKITGVGSLLDIESKEIEKELTDFLNK